MIRLYSLIVIVLISCRQNETSSDVQITTDSSSLSIITREDSFQLQILSTQVLTNNKTGILSIHFNHDTMTLISDKDLTWNPFGLNIKSPQQFKNRHKGLFVIKDSFLISPKEGHLLTSNSSSIFFRKLDKKDLQKEDDTEHENDMKAPYELFRASIKDTFLMAYGLKVGITKRVFFETVINYYNPVLNKISVVLNSDPLGEILDTYFVFSQGILSEIKMEKPK